MGLYGLWQRRCSGVGKRVAVPPRSGAFGLWCLRETWCFRSLSVLCPRRLRLSRALACIARAVKSLAACLLSVGILAAGCTSAPKASRAESRAYYLGIPSDEEYPQTTFQLEQCVPRNRYYRVSRLSHVTREQYERDQASGRMRFRERHGTSEFYATEFSGDFEQQPGVRAWVTILERKVYP